MTQTQRIRNPSLTLYAFHLRNDISQGAEKATVEASQLWESLADVGQTLGIEELQNLRQKLICYENSVYNPVVEEKIYPQQLTLLPSGEESIDFRFINHSGVDLNGLLSPFRLHDIYAVDLTLFSEDTIDITQLSQLDPKNILSSEKIRASLGQTLLLYAEPVEALDDYQVLADTCVAQSG
ncbi:hypothetical protein NIES2101_29885 [Calothrix sp. HK-06]|nr:hypothetical protein NIES2101_29885 [Calothrix sp. HK-06]